MNLVVTPNIDFNSDNPYEVLGIEKNSLSPEIVQAYKKLCKIYHPDISKSREVFDKIRSAYDILSNPENKKLYDDYGINANSEKDETTKRAMQIIGQAIAACINKRGIENIYYFNPVEDITECVKADLYKIEDCLAKNKKQLSMFKTRGKGFLKRLKINKKAKAPNLFKQFMDGQIDHITVTIKQQERDLLVAKKMLELLEDYSYEAEENPKSNVQAASYGNTNFVQFTVPRW